MNVVLNARNRGTHTHVSNLYSKASRSLIGRMRSRSSLVLDPLPTKLAMLAIAVLLTHFLSVFLYLTLSLSPQFPTRSYNLLYSLYSAIFGVIFYWLCDYFKVVIHIVAFLQAKTKWKTWKTKKKKTKQITKLRLKFVLGLTSISCCCLIYYANILV